MLTANAPKPTNAGCLARYQAMQMLSLPLTANWLAVNLQAVLMSRAIIIKMVLEVSLTTSSSAVHQYVEPKQHHIYTDLLTK